MPTPTRFETGALSITQELVELHRVRLVLVDQIAALQFACSNQDQDLLNLVLAFP